MKTASTYYFALLAAANVFVAHLIALLCLPIRLGLTQVVEGERLPPFTNLILTATWWPYVFVGLFSAGALLSLGTRWRSEALCHAVIVLLMLEAFILFCNFVAYALPFVSIIEH